MPSPPTTTLCRMSRSIALVFSVLPMIHGAGSQPADPMPSAPVIADAEAGGEEAADAGHARVIEQLQSIVIPSIDFENVSLEDGMNFFRIRAAELDASTVTPDEAGVNIIVRPPRVLALGQMLPAIRSLKLKNVPLGTALQLACESAGYRYSVQQSTIVVEPLPAAPSPSPAPVTSVPTPDHSIPASPSFGSSELSKALSPLRSPDIQSAKMALSHLQEMADNSTGADKVALLQLATVIKNVFAADYQVAAKMIALDQSEKDARHQEKLAAEWLKPNTFGTVNKEASRDAMKRAGEIRKKARTELRDARDALVLRLRDADASILIYERRNELNVVSILASALLSIQQRSLEEGDYHPSYSRRDIARLDQFIAAREEWWARACDAEKSGHYETAIRFYGKARDQRSRERCANLMASYLVESGYFGSAIDYYEMAGNQEKVRLIRQLHPQLSPEHFRVMTPVELVAKIAPCCVDVSHGNTRGSGFFFQKGGHILTNHHLVDQARNLQVRLDDGTSLPAVVIASSVELDLAIIKIDRENHPVIGFRIHEVKKGQPVFTLGDPENEHADPDLHTGMIASTDAVINDNPVHALVLSAYPDKSGAPIVDPSGRLVGVFTLRPSGNDQEKPNHAIPVAAVGEFVRQQVK